MRTLLLLLVLACGMAHASAQALLPYREGYLYGYKDRYGKIVVDANYHATWRLWNSTFKVVQYNRYVGLIDAHGVLRIPGIYTAINDIYHQKWITARKGKYAGISDTYGRTIIPFDYEELYFCYGATQLILAKKEDKWGMLDTLGRTVIPFEYNKLGFGFSEGLIAAQKDGSYGFIDINNTVVVPFMYKEANEFSEGLAFVGDFGHMGYINRKNDTIIPFDYAFASHQTGFENGWAKVRQGHREGYIDTGNHVRIPLRYTSIGKFHDGLAAVHIGDPSGYPIWEYGYVDSSGKEYLYPYITNLEPGIQMPPAPKRLPDAAHRLYKNPGTDQAWTLETLLEHALKAFRLEPVNYPDLDRLGQVCLSYGFLIGGGNYGEDFMYGEGWEAFKKETLFPLFSTEVLRKLAWEWVRPLYREQFQTMNPFEKKAYRETAEYLRRYINTYDRKKTEHFLDTDEARFAYYNADGQPDKHRKLSAFVDRLILIHGLVSENEARRWINIMADEVDTW